MFGVLVAIGILFAVVKVLDKLDGKWVDYQSFLDL
jgi:hypothetical protein